MARPFFRVNFDILSWVLMVLKRDFSPSELNCSSMVIFF
jgi:hypothetical protein